jgi:hypothetical protein
MRLGYVVLCCLVALGACASEPDPRPEGPTAPAVSTFRLSLPFDEFKWNPREKGLLEQARYLLVKRCVETRGVDFTMPETKRTSELPDFYDNSRRYGVLDEQAAALFGYHLPRTADSRRRQQETEEWNKKVRKTEEIAIYGKDDQPGCYQQADAELATGVPEADPEWLGERGSESLTEAEQHKTVVQAKAGWRTCMSKLGFGYGEPNEAIEDKLWKLDSSAISDQEIATAVADVRCKHSAGLVTAFVEVETAWQRGLIEREPERFRQLKAAKDAQLEAAARASS